MPRKRKPPAYRKRMIRGREVAYLTLRDCRTKRPKDYNLGAYGSDASRELYARLVAAWEACSRRLPAASRNQRPTGGLTVTQLCHAYWQAVGGKQLKQRYATKQTIRVLRSMCGSIPAEAFGPNAMREIRDAMIRGNPDADPPRPSWSRRTVTDRVHRIGAIFKWATAHELLPIAIYQAVKTLEPIPRGVAREPEPVRPVPDTFVDAALQHMRPQVRAMVELQRTTGMRPGEIIIMRTRDIGMTGKVWVYQPAEHKTAHHGHARMVYLGPRTQAVLRPWLRTDLDAYFFQPAEAVADLRRERHARRATPAGQGNEPGTNRQAEPKRLPSDRYTTDSYRRAIVRACDKADRKAREEAQAVGRDVVDDERLVPRWHPHQLRHNYATNVRREYGLEAAQILLGHSSALVTDAVYAERDQTKAIEIAQKLG